MWDLQRRSRDAIETQPQRVLPHSLETTVGKPGRSVRRDLDKLHGKMGVDQLGTALCLESRRKQRPTSDMEAWVLITTSKPLGSLACEFLVRTGAARGGRASR